MSGFRINLAGVEQIGLDEFAGFAAHGDSYILPTQPIGQFLKALWLEGQSLLAYVYGTIFIYIVSIKLAPEKMMDDRFDRVIFSESSRSYPGLRFDQLARKADFVDVCLQSRREIFDPYARSERQVTMVEVF